MSYNGRGYTYYFISKDMAGYGINFSSESDLVKNGADFVVSGNQDLRNYLVLADNYYNIYGDDIDYLVDGFGSKNVWKEPTNAESVKSIVDVIKKKEPDELIDIIQVVNVSTCKR